MTIQFKESTTYKLQADYYESIVIECVYVEDNTVWFVQRPPYAFCPDLGSYKLDRKTNTAYWLNQGFSIWETIENTLSENTAEDIWSKRIGNGGGDGYYSGCGQGD